jgi:hypothetical protein
LPKAGCVSLSRPTTDLDLMIVRSNPGHYN